jgi:hypothetical protein
MRNRPGHINVAAALPLQLTRSAKLFAAIHKTALRERPLPPSASIMKQFLSDTLL